MIAYLKGQVLKKLEKQIILDTGKVGYLINIPKLLLEELEENDFKEFFIYTNVRENEISLYGTETLEEYNFFKNLISISGVGPKLALDILSVPINTMKNAILQEDVTSISKIPGIGKKTAERIILELKGKVEITGEREYRGIGPSIDEDALEALINLGYQKNLIQKVLQALPEKLEKSEDIIKYFLKNA